MEDTNIIRKVIYKTLKTLFEMKINEQGGYPVGTAYDPNAPWNEQTLEITYVIDYASQQFIVTCDNGAWFKVDFIDVLEIYWKNHPGSYQSHENMFGADETTADYKIIEFLANEEQYDFTDILISYGEFKNLLTSPDMSDSDSLL